PVQVTWLGFPATTGLTAIDWRITDSCTDLPDADPEYAEKLWRLDDIFCAYRPMSRFPLYRYHPDYCVRTTPALDAGHITFGSCNNLSKLTDEVLQTWAQLLQAVPNSRLLVEGKGFESDATRSDFTRRFVGLGGDAGQLELIPRRSDQQYLTYHRIDIALDPFPLTGGTTSFDLLWMGVPMVTMQGDSFRSRMGVTMAKVLGHDDWVARDRQDYIAIAARMAADLPALNRQRLAQRLRMERSPLMDEALFAHRFGTALRQMWYGWCARRRTADTREQDALIQTWSTHPWPAPRQVTIGPGQVISLQQAHQRLQALTDEALRLAPREQLLAGCTEPPEVTHEAWFKVLDWCEYLLDSIPKEPLALATLAELEHAHGRTAYAATYLHYAQESLSNP
ncbi:MAG: acetylglucosamine transferase, partial [Rhodoferax sp.]|nr:acetylglucosamine transferase [Rhodoferax sp.]